MRNQKITSALFVAAVFFSCAKEIGQADNLQQPPSSSAVKAGTASLTTTQDCDLLSFKNQGPGINITSVSSDGGMWITLTTGVSVPSIMNSALPFSDNRDMGTPNIMHGGLGMADPGRCDGGASNNTALENLLILQWPGYTAHPNEADLSTSDSWIDMHFPKAITANSIKVLDVENEESEGGMVFMYGTAGLIDAVSIPNTCSNGVTMIDLKGTANVTRIRLQIDGSMGFDELAFCTPPSFPCTYTQGFWKNHEDAWPVSSLSLGTTTYSKAALIAILKMPVRGNGLISLAHQLIAAKLNVAKGADPTAVSAFIAQADGMIGSLIIPGGTLPTALTSTLTGKLDAYNNGLIGPGHCDD